jgi:hypothetical protein
MKDKKRIKKAVFYNNYKLHDNNMVWAQWENDLDLNSMKMILV